MKQRAKICFSHFLKATAKLILSHFTTEVSAVWFVIEPVFRNLQISLVRPKNTAYTVSPVVGIICCYHHLISYNQLVALVHQLTGASIIEEELPAV